MLPAKLDAPIWGCTMYTVHEEEADLKGGCKGLDSTLHSFEFDSLTGSPPSGWTSAGHPSHPSFPPPPQFTSRHGNRMKMGKKWKKMRKRLKKRKKEASQRAFPGQYWRGRCGAATSSEVSQPAPTRAKPQSLPQAPRRLCSGDRPTNATSVSLQPSI